MHGQADQEIAAIVVWGKMGTVLKLRASIALGSIFDQPPSHDLIRQPDSRHIQSTAVT